MKTLLTTLLLALALLTLAPPAPAQWTNDPWNGMVPVCTAEGGQRTPKICRLGAGWYLIVWFDDRTGYEDYRAYYQILDANGIPLLEPDGSPLFSCNWQTSPFDLIPDGMGGGICVFYDNRDGTWDVYGQRFDSLGNRLWGETGLPLVVWPGSGEVQLKDVQADGSNGVFISYGIYQYPDTDIYIQRINNQGDRLWGSYGVAIQVDPNITAAEDKIVQDGSGGAIDVWEKYSGSSPHLWAQHFDFRGNIIWGNNGVQLFDPQSGQPLGVNNLAGGIPDGAGGAIYIYDTFWNWFLFRLPQSGQVAWLYYFSLPDTCYTHPPLRHPTDSSIYFSTYEKRMGLPWSWYLYRFDNNGNPLFGPSGVATGGLLTPTQDGVIGVRIQQHNALSVLRGTRIDSNGVVHWQSAIALINQASAIWDLTSIADGLNGTICVWSRRYDANEYDVYAQRVRSDGSLGNPLPPYPYAPDYPYFNLYAREGSVYFSLPQAGPITLELYDLLGRKIQNLAEGYHSAGRFTVAFDQEHLPSGVYLLRLSTSQERHTIKLVVIR